jgi:molecular chaperone DnaJ
MTIMNPCDVCSGSGRSWQPANLSLNIPEGVKDGDTIRFTGEGEPGERGGRPGDLLCNVTVKPHEHFKRSGDDILVECRVPFVLAALGGSFAVPTLEGPKVLEVKPGLQSGDILKIRGAGVAAVRGGKRGDQLVRVAVDVPKVLTGRQEELLREFAQIGEQVGQWGKMNLKGKT